ncbi:hypothetical protein D9619_007846 [Psilocybe cf. subviscida]|uniref:Malate dehydrogenase n=1 Tax=Psilocybe cf. subviscida TaxID=2480587 RepID=A0A8H5ATD4_9AGAR|nr:hypothetical protein D9619_007846 [Psilocybe cf. subviscida]
MLSFTTLISLSLALTAPFAASARVIKRSGCDVSSMAIPHLPATMSQSTLKGAWVGIAIGTQNYTCSSAGTYTNVGALAELFDVSCLVNTPIFASLPDLAINAWEAAPPAVPASQLISLLHGFGGVLGQHYYVVNPLTGTGINPKWDFTSASHAGDASAYVVAAKTTGTAAPTGSQDIDWVFLTGLTGENKLAQQVYRTDTRLGQPPATCTPGTPNIVVKYAAKYWGYGSSL